MIGRKRTGGLILGTFLLIALTVAGLVLFAGRAALLETALSSSVLTAVAVGLVAAGLAWVVVIARTWWLARPSGLDAGRQGVGVVVVLALCMLVATPFGYAANLASSSSSLLDTLFVGGGGGTAAAEAIAKPRLNILLVGSDAGPDRTGARTDTMMVASIDTRTARTTLFGLPRNLGYAQFPPGSAMAEEFPDGFRDPSDPNSGDYLLNAVYAWGIGHPEDAPPGPTADPGLNLLHQTISYMLGLQLDYYTEVDMAGFAAMIDALGGLTVDVGPEPVPIGGISPTGKRIKPDGYIPAGVQQLTGEQALSFARSRTDGTDYKRMGRQRCLLQNILAQKSPADLLTNFQSVAAATTDSVATNIPQDLLPKLVALAGSDTLSLESISFDPNLADPAEEDGRFDTGRPNFPHMRDVVERAVTAPPAPVAPDPGATPPPPGGTDPDAEEKPVGEEPTEDEPPPPSDAPTSLAATC